MSHKQHLREILAQLRTHADRKEDSELHEHLNTLENAINAMDATDDGDGEPGGDTPPPPDVP